MTSHKLQLYAAFTWYSSLPLRAHLFYLENTASVFVLFVTSCTDTRLHKHTAVPQQREERQNRINQISWTLLHLREHLRNYDLCACWLVTISFL